MTNYVCKAQPPPTAVSSASYFGHSLFFHSPPAILTRHAGKHFLLFNFVRGVSYRPQGTEFDLLNDVNFSLPEKRYSSCPLILLEMNMVFLSIHNVLCYLLVFIAAVFGLIFGRSGSGKTTLLQLLAGINKPTSGSIFVQKYGDDGKLTQTSEPLPSERVGILFQFPERY
ncbi:ABC transporter I family member 11, chloroplastic [Vitis vinifera]|uniref:ABC transporter I family member 11, chloroplastic n=1 Tax=Vitis vinifera TaxID=29760 RepID=A0A438JCY2_VITVI|nr:ABC transporter I family member 11, chloroplastic [Vitis vinifera]